MRIFSILFSIFLLISILISISNFASAQTCDCPEGECKGGIVPCGRTCDDPETAICECDPCSLCHAFVLLKRIVDFLLINIALPFFLISILAGGIMFTLAGGEPGKIKKGRETLIKGLIGFVIALCSWVIVNTIIVTLTGSEKIFASYFGIGGKRWYQVECRIPPKEKFKWPLPKIRNYTLNN